MARKKVNKQILNLLETCISNNHRSMFFIMGKKSRYQVVILYHLLLKSLSSSKCSVLWCFQRELGFSKHNDRRIRQLKKQYQSGDVSMTENEVLFDHFLVATNVQYCHYNDTDTILGQTHKIAVLQDFDALTPNIIARITETVEGGGMLIFLLPNITTLDQLANHKMHVHLNYASDAHPSVSLRFNNRFVLSLRSCKNCLVLDDELKEIISCPSMPNSEEKPQSFDQTELLKLKHSQAEVKYMKKIIDQCCTVDQAKALLIFYSSLLERKLYSVTALTSARGRGKSSTLGLSVALALALKYSNIFVTSPHVENLGTLFTFLIIGLQLLKYKENDDYAVSYATNEDGMQSVSQIEIFKSHHQIVKYIQPMDYNLLHNADLVIIDEAAAIPLPFVKKWIGPFKVFMASTVNGYEGTGRSLSLKLISHLRKQSVGLQNNKTSISPSSSNGHSLIEVSLNQPIRYHENDAVEAWLNNLLCLDATVVPHISGASPDPQQCQLYYVNRDTLFSYSTAAEKFLQNAIALFVAAHYKNSPNDLLMVADAPAHHVFCLLPPFEGNFNTLPNILCVIQVALEGRISKPVIVQDKSTRGKRGGGDLIPWIISQQFLDDDFPSYSGARIVRIATHPEFQKMGYGLRALQILSEYYKGSYISPNKELNVNDVSSSQIKAKKEPVENQKILLRNLLLRLQEREPEMLDYVGVSYGLTYELLRFWKKAGFVPLYVRQSQNEVTGEHSCVMIKELSTRLASKKCLFDYFLDFSERFRSLLSSAFRNMPINLAFDILTNAITRLNYAKEVSIEELNFFISSRSKKRLKMYCNHQIDYHLIMDLLPVIARLYFNHQLNLTLPNTQAEILLCLGLKSNSLEDTSKELNLQVSEAMGLLTQILKKVLHSLNNKLESRTILNEKGDYSENKTKSFHLKNQTKLEVNGPSNFNSSKHTNSNKSFKRQMTDSCVENFHYKKKSKFV